MSWVADEFDVQAEADLRRKKQVPANDLSGIHRSFSSSCYGRRVSSRKKMKLFSQCKGKCDKQPFD